jgi:hypothetical protein
MRKPDAKVGYIRFAGANVSMKDKDFARPAIRSSRDPRAEVIMA